MRVATLFACGGANYRTAVHSSPCPNRFAQLDLGMHRAGTATNDGTQTA